MSRILLTSFDTWLPHQSSNSSDDLLVTLLRQAPVDSHLSFLRQLPVDIHRASERAIAAINQTAPAVIICCGMAESRRLLTVESNATGNNEKLETSINLLSLVSQLSYTDISHHAGRFVCEGLYYQVLKHSKQYHYQTQCLFVHVPVMTTNNMRAVVTDFQLIVKQVSSNLDT